MKNFLKKLIKTLFPIKIIDNKISYKTGTTKTIISANEYVTLSAETEKNKSLLRKNAEDIAKNCDYNPQKIIDFIKNSGTKIVISPHALKLLNIIGEEEGFLPHTNAFNTLFLKLFFQAPPVFIIKSSSTELLYHYLYKWCAYRMNIPGANINLHLNKQPKNNLTPEEIVSLNEAIQLDKEAIDFTLFIEQKTKGANKVKEKMVNGGADI